MVLSTAPSKPASENPAYITTSINWLELAASTMKAISTGLSCGHSFVALKIKRYVTTGQWDKSKMLYVLSDQLTRNSDSVSLEKG